MQHFAFWTPPGDLTSCVLQWLPHCSGKQQVHHHLPSSCLQVGEVGKTCLSGFQNLDNSSQQDVLLWEVVIHALPERFTLLDTK